MSENWKTEIIRVQKLPKRFMREMRIWVYGVEREGAGYYQTRIS